MWRQTVTLFNEKLKWPNFTEKKWNRNYLVAFIFTHFVHNTCSSLNRAALKKNRTDRLTDRRTCKKLSNLATCWVELKILIPRFKFTSQCRYINGIKVWRGIKERKLFKGALSRFWSNPIFMFLLFTML